MKGVGQRAGRPDRRAVEEGRVLDLLEATARYAEEGTRGGPPKSLAHHSLLTLIRS